MATITEEGAAARVGSNFSDIREVTQVHLHRGEKVEVLEAQRDGPLSSQRPVYMVQDCPALGRVSLDFGPADRRELRPRRPATGAAGRSGRGANGIARSLYGDGHAYRYWRQPPLPAAADSSNVTAATTGGQKPGFDGWVAAQHPHPRTAQMPAVESPCSTKSKRRRPKRLWQKPR